MNTEEYTETQNIGGDIDKLLAVSRQDEHVAASITMEESAPAAMSHIWRPQDADREYIKQVIRRRVRDASVSENAVFIPAKPKPTIQDDENKSVAVYARVSTKSTEQVSSIENQTKYYTKR